MGWCRPVCTFHFRKSQCLLRLNHCEGGTSENYFLRAAPIEAFVPLPLATHGQGKGVGAPGVSEYFHSSLA